MPRITSPIADEYQAITRRIVVGLSKYIMELLDLPYDVDMLFKGESTQVTVWNTETKKFRKPSEIEHNGRFTSGNQLEIEAKEDIIEAGYGMNQFRAYRNLPPIWYHPLAKISLQPNYITKTITVTFTYRSKAMELADRFRNQLLTLLATKRDVLLVNLLYYIVPHPTQIDILKYLKGLTEETSKDDVWLSKYSAENSLTDLKDHKLGGNAEYAFKEVQNDVPLILEVREITEKQKRNQGPGYDLSFDVKLTYDKPYSTVLDFPIVIKNKMVSKEVIQIPYVDNPLLLSGHSHTLRTMEDVLTDNYYYRGGKVSFTDIHGVVVPLGDDWEPPAFNRTSAIVFQGLVPYREKDENNQRIVGNLLKYSKYIYLSPSLITYLKTYPDKAKYLNDGLLLVSLFVNHTRVDYNRYHITKDLDVITDIDISIWDSVHLVLTIPTNFEDYEYGFFTQLSKYPPLAEEVAYQYSLSNYVSSVQEELNEMKRSIRLGRTTPVQYRLMERLYQNFPYSQLGLWHKVLEVALLKTSGVDYQAALSKIAEKYRYLVDELLKYYQDNPLKELSNQYREPLYDVFRTNHTELIEQNAYRIFYGSMDPHRFVNLLMTRRPNTYLTHDFGMHSMRTQMKGYIENYRKEA